MKNMMSPEEATTCIAAYESVENLIALIAEYNPLDKMILEDIILRAHVTMLLEVYWAVYDDHPELAEKIAQCLRTVRAVIREVDKQYD